jgi:hypothetical protein
MFRMVSASVAALTLIALTGCGNVTGLASLNAAGFQIVHPMGSGGGGPAGGPHVDGSGGGGPAGGPHSHKDGSGGGGPAG